MGENKVVGIARIDGKRKAGASKRLNGGGGACDRRKANAGVVDDEIVQRKCAAKGLCPHARLIDGVGGEFGLGMVCQSHGNFVGHAFGQVQRTAFNIQSLVIDAIGLKSVDHGAASHDGKTAVGVVEHHIRSVEGPTHEDAC